MMLQVIFGVFCVLHGLVHLLYFGQSARYFELRPGMQWPDGAWAFSKQLADETVRKLANTVLVVAAIGFVTGGIGILIEQEWWYPVVGSTAAFSAISYILFWDGTLQDLDDKGGIGILINIAILIALAVGVIRP